MSGLQFFLAGKISQEFLARFRMPHLLSCDVRDKRLPVCGLVKAALELPFSGSKEAGEAARGVTCASESLDLIRQVCSAIPGS